VTMLAMDDAIRPMMKNPRKLVSPSWSLLADEAHPAEHAGGDSEATRCCPGCRVRKMTEKSAL